MIYPRKPHRVNNILYKNSTPYNENSNEINTGQLEISVYDYEQNKPVENALIRIFKVSYTGQFNEIGEGILISQYLTDKNGKMPIVNLPEQNELMPNNKDYYTVSVHADGYDNAYAFNIQIYPNIPTSYNIYLSNISSEGEKFHFIIQPKTEEIHKR